MCATTVSSGSKIGGPSAEEESLDAVPVILVRGFLPFSTIRPSCCGKKLVLEHQRIVVPMHPVACRDALHGIFLFSYIFLSSLSFRWSFFKTVSLFLFTSWSFILCHVFWNFFSFQKTVSFLLFFLCLFCFFHFILQLFLITFVFTFDHFSFYHEEQWRFLFFMFPMSTFAVVE